MKSKQLSEHGKAFAKGGSTHMLPKQAANPQAAGRSAHVVKGGAPGAKSARGGPPIRGVSTAVPAKPGKTGPDNLRKSR
jgi:hypothetical protein